MQLQTQIWHFTWCLKTKILNWYMTICTKPNQFQILLLHNLEQNIAMAHEKDQLENNLNLIATIL